MPERDYSIIPAGGEPPDSFDGVARVGWETLREALPQRAVPGGSPLEARGFALYVGLSEDEAISAGVDLRVVVAALRSRLATVPGVESHASVVFAREGIPGSSLEIVRATLREPGSRGAGRQRPQRAGLVVDLARHRVEVDGQPVHLTYKESLLLRRLVSRQGRTLTRDDLLHALAGREDGEEISERSVDVYIRRVRRRLEPYGDVILTLRGAGYRFDPHPDVTVLHASAPSPDLF